MTVHLINGETAATRLRAAQDLEPQLAGPVYALPDQLSHGSLYRPEGKSFAQVRADYWRAIRGQNGDENPEEAQQEELLLEVSNILQRKPDVQVWFWMAPQVADVVAWYHSLRYLGKHVGRFYVLNIAGLPFLNEEGKVFFPQAFDGVPAREFVKARRLARLVTPAELELDGDVWKAISGPESFYRFPDGGRKIKTEEAAYFDRDLLQALRSGPLKTSRLLNQLLQKQALPTEEAALVFRIRQLFAEGLLTVKGDLQKSPRDWEIRLLESATIAAVPSPENETAG